MIRDSITQKEILFRKESMSEVNNTRDVNLKPLLHDVFEVSEMRENEFEKNIFYLIRKAVNEFEKNKEHERSSWKDQQAFSFSKSLAIALFKYKGEKIICFERESTFNGVFITDLNVQKTHLLSLDINQDSIEKIPDYINSYIINAFIIDVDNDENVNKLLEQYQGTGKKRYASVEKDEEILIYNFNELKKMSEFKEFYFERSDFARIPISFEINYLLKALTYIYIYQCYFYTYYKNNIDAWRDNNELVQEMLRKKYKEIQIEEINYILKIFIYLSYEGNIEHEIDKLRVLRININGMDEINQQIYNGIPFKQDIFEVNEMLIEEYLKIVW